MNNLNIEPDIKISVNQTFGIETDMEIDAFSKKNQYVPKIDNHFNDIHLMIVGEKNNEYGRKIEIIVSKSNCSSNLCSCIFLSE